MLLQHDETIPVHPAPGTQMVFRPTQQLGIFDREALVDHRLFFVCKPADGKPGVVAGHWSDWAWQPEPATAQP